MNSNFVPDKSLAKHQITKKEWEKIVHLNQFLANGLKCVDTDKIQYNNTIDNKKVEAENIHKWEERFFDFKNKVEDNSQSNEKYCSPLQVNDKSKYSVQEHVIKEDSNKTFEVPSVGNNNLNDSMNKNEENVNECCSRKRKRSEMNSNNFDCKFQGTGLTCIGILPGLGVYEDSSDDSDQSCSSSSEANENVKYDLVGRPLVYQSKAESR